MLTLAKELKKEDVIQNKKEAIKSLNKMLESFINDSSNMHLKKADLISYWIKSYSSYISSEEFFTPQKLIRYKRGSIIKVNFGFNIGKELGGLHFAVVLDNDNKRNADVLTVIPLSSTDGKDVHERSVDLGAELYKKVSAKQTNLLEKAQKELEDLQEAGDALQSSLDLLRDIESRSTNSEVVLKDKIEKIINYQQELIKKEELLNKSIHTLEKNGAEIAKLKIGSMAVVNQITTISKQRIYTPKKSEDFLYGVSLSPSAMDKINEKLKELYTFN